MGTIADKLSYLNETKTQFREKLNKLGADILDNVTFRSYLIYLNNLYNGLFNLTDMSKNGIVGRTSQEDTPTPTTPQEIRNLSGDITYSISGKNLFNEIYPDIVNETTKYVSLHVGDGTFTMSSNVSLPPDNPYASLFFITGQATSGASTSENGVYLNRPITIASTNGYVTIGYRILGGINPEDYQTMIEKGSTATTYEEYKSASYEINLGKNLLDLQLSIMKSLNTSGTWSENVYTHNGLTLTINDDKTIKINGTATDQETFLLENQQIKYPTGTYYLSGSINGGNNSYDIRMFNYDGTSAVAQCYTGTKEINVINNKQVYNMAIVVRSGQTLNNVVFYPMFSTSNDTNYSPYFTPIELCKIGTYQDKIYAKDNKFYLHKQIGKFTYNGEGNFTTPATNYYNINGLGNQGWITTIQTQTYISTEYPPISVLNTDSMFREATANMDYAFGIHPNGTGIRFKDSRGLSGADFKADLIGTEFYFVLTTSSTTEITSASHPTLYNQLKEIQDYLIKYKSKYELILNYDKPNIKY